MIDPQLPVAPFPPFSTAPMRLGTPTSGATRGSQDDEAATRPSLTAQAKGLCNGVDFTMLSYYSAVSHALSFVSYHLSLPAAAMFEVYCEMTDSPSLHWVVLFIFWSYSLVHAVIAAMPPSAQMGWTTSSLMTYVYNAILTIVRAVSLEGVA
jgi:hypothetical protein